MSICEMLWILSFAKNMDRNIGKSKSKNWSSKYSPKLLDHAKESTTDTLKTGSEKAIQKTAEETGDLIVTRILIKFKKSPKLHHRIVQKWLQMKQKIWNMIGKYLEKDISFQKKYKSLLMIYD